MLLPRRFGAARVMAAGDGIGSTALWHAGIAGRHRVLPLKLNGTIDFSRGRRPGKSTLALLLLAGVVLYLALLAALWGPAASLRAAPANPAEAEQGAEVSFLPTPSVVTADGEGRLTWHWRRVPLQLLASFAAFGLALLATGLVFIPLEALAGESRRRGLVRAGMSTDAAYWFFTPLVAKPISKATVVIVPALAVWVLGLSLPTSVDQLRAFWAAQSLWLVIPAMVLICDFSSYWMHRLLHTRWLWRFHAIHHSSEDVIWLSSVRAHPMEDLLMRWAQVVPLLVLGFPIATVALLASALSLASLVLHADLPWTLGPLRYVVSTPVFHRWHHTCQSEALDKNFAGLLPVFDLVFGTLHLPRGASARRFGLTDQSVPYDIAGQLLYPFKRLAPRQG